MRNTALDGLRGWAALVVAIYHGFSSSYGAAHEILLKPLQDIENPTDIIEKLLISTFNGSLSVIIFFVLSGRVLFVSLLRSEGGFAEKSLRFTIKRFIRIYPPLWCALGAFMLMYFIMHHVFHWEAGPSMLSVFVNASLIKVTMYGVTWSLNVEILAIPIILISVFLYEKYGASVLFMILAILLLVYGSRMTLYVPYIPTYSFMFALGFISSTKIGDEIGSSMMRLNAFVVVAFLLYVPMLFPYDMSTVMIYQGVLSFLLVVQIANSTPDGMKKFLQNPTSQFLGHISFSLYLLHPLALTMLEHLAYTFNSNFKENYLVFGLLTGILTPILTIPLAMLMYTYVEKPTIEIGRRWADTISQRVFGPQKILETHKSG